MPSFTEGDDGEEKGVATVITGFVATFPPDMCERINEQGSVKQDGRADEEGPDEELSGGDS